MLNFHGKVVLVTGGSTGIGLSAAKLFLKQGSKIAINYLPSDEAAPDTVREIKRMHSDVIGVPGDISIPGEAKKMVETAVSTYGRLDILINNAGTAAAREPIPFSDLDAMTEAFWDRVLRTNLIGTFWCAKAAAATLRDAEGCIINVASIAGLGHAGSSIAYGASKAGVLNLTKSLARALAPRVRVNAVAPGQVRSPWTSQWPEAARQRFIDNSLLQRLVELDDIALAMLFLAGNKSMTGETVVVDCGRTV